METQDLLTEAEASDPRRPIVLFGLGYITLCVVAVWIDFKIQMRRARKRREARERADRGGGDGPSKRT